MRSSLRTSLILACVLVPPAVYAEITIMDEIVCKVNGDIVTKSDLDKKEKDLEQFLQQNGLTGAKFDEELKAQKPNLLRQEIDDLLLAQKAKEMDIKVDTDLNKQMADLQRRSKITDPDKFQAFVQEQTGMPYEDYRGMMKDNLLRQRVKRVYTIGAAAQKIESQIRGATAINSAGNMEMAVQQAAASAQPGDIVLLAPACASFDQFKNYEHRGKVFKELVLALR